MSLIFSDRTRFITEKSLLRDVSGKDIKTLYSRLENTYIPKKVTNVKGKITTKNKIKRNI